MVQVCSNRGTARRCAPGRASAAEGSRPTAEATSAPCAAEPVPARYAACAPPVPPRGGTADCPSLRGRHAVRGPRDPGADPAAVRAPDPARISTLPSRGFPSFHRHASKIWRRSESNSARLRERCYSPCSPRVRSIGSRTKGAARRPTAESVAPAAAHRPRCRPQYGQHGAQVSGSRRASRSVSPHRSISPRSGDPAPKSPYQQAR